MRFGLTVLVLHLCMFGAPFLETRHTNSQTMAFPGWPVWVEKMDLEEVPLLDDEQRWAEHFPGVVGRFEGDGEEYLVRWVRYPTRSLHPISHCLRGSGYRVTPAPLRRGDDGTLWGCSNATKAGKSLEFCEQIRDSQGNTWSDVSSWYWASVLGRSTGPWWAVARSSLGKGS